MTLLKARRVRVNKKEPPKRPPTPPERQRPVAPVPPPTPRFPPMEERVKTTVQFTNTIYLGAKRRAREMGQSFNSYLAFLIYRDLTPVHSPVVQVSMPPVPRDLTGAAPISLPKQRNPLDRFGDVYIYKSEDDPSMSKIAVPWAVVGQYEAYLRTHYKEGDNVPDAWTLARKMGLSNPDYGLAADQAIETGEWAAYMKARDLAVKRGFTPDDDLSPQEEGTDAEADA